MRFRLPRLAIVLALVVFLTAFSSLVQGQGLAPRALVVVEADDFEGLRSARQAVEAAGGRVQGMTPPSTLLVRLAPEADEELMGTAGIVEIHRGPVEDSGPGKNARRAARSRGERMVLAAWNQRLRAKSPRVQRAPLPPELLGVDVLEAPFGTDGDGGDDPPPGTPGPRSSTTNSYYLVGDCVVTIFLTESDGSLEPSTENWTEAEEAQVTAEIQEGLSWLADLANTTHNANVTFIYEWHYREPTKYEPIRTTATWPAGNAAAYEIMQRRGYAASTSGGRAFNSAQRLAYGADMAFTIFVADSSNDSDGYFADGYIAYAYLHGPWVVQNYKNDGWGISRMNQVTAHETGHIFGAGDEYAASGATADQRYGYLLVLNGNAVNGGTGASCLMNNNALTICKWTRGQLGLHLPDTPDDGTPDSLQYDAGGTTRRDQLAYAAHALSDDNLGASAGNGNGLLEGGEIIELHLTVRNDAYVQMRGVTATLSSSSPWIALVNDRAAIGTVDYTGGQATTAEPLVFAVVSGAPVCTATVTVELATAQGWHFTFTLDLALAGTPPDSQAPAVPTGLAVTGTGDGWVGLDWDQNTEDDLSHYNVYRSENENTGYALVGQRVTSDFVDEAVLNGRTYYYKVSATDTSGNESARCAAVSAALEDQAPTVTILAPETGTTYDHDEEVDFSATAADREDGSLSGAIVWSSSLQGHLGTGAGLSRALDPGTHLITASVTDSGGNEASDLVTVIVRQPNGPPTVAIVLPVDGEAFTTADLVNFIGTAGDPEDGDLSDVIRWTSSRDGDLGQGAEVAHRLTAGQHTITASATDSAGQTRADQVTVTVGLVPLAAPTDVRITTRGVSVKLRWDDPNDDETGYRVERAPDAPTPSWQVVALVAADATEFKGSVPERGDYLFRVRAVRLTELGPVSETVAVYLDKRAKTADSKTPHVSKQLAGGPGALTGAVASGGRGHSAGTPTDAAPGSAASAAQGVQPRVARRADTTEYVIVATVGLLGEVRARFAAVWAQMRQSLRRGIQ